VTSEPRADGCVAGMSVPRIVTVADVIDEIPNVVTLRVVAVDGDLPSFEPGQVSMLGAFGVGEATISISSSTSETRFHDYTVRRAGPITQALTDLRPGEQCWFRGPFGSAWDLRGGTDVLVAAGGIGLAPLRSAVAWLVDHRADYGRVVLVVGAGTPDDLLYAEEYAAWSAVGIEVISTVDRSRHGWSGPVGSVADAIAEVGVDAERTTALMCGPDPMMSRVADGLVARGVPASRIQLTLERNMQCGVGTCGHCQLGGLIVCRDGPAVTYDRLGRSLHVAEV
jgi:anaerobic sulfite reductase subunit B